MNLGEATIVALVFGLAGLVKGVIGLGLPTISMGLLGALMPPGQAAAILIVPALATNAWQIWDAHSDDRDQSFQRIATSVTWVRDGAVGCCF